jgi:hypothetical protein
MQRVSWQAEELLASQEGFWSKQLQFPNKRQTFYLKMVKTNKNMQWVRTSERIFHTYRCVWLNTYQHTKTHIPANYNVLFLSHGDQWLRFLTPVGLRHHTIYCIYCMSSSSDVSLFTLLSTVTDVAQCCSTHRLQKIQSTGVLLLFFNLRTAAFKAYCVIWVRHSNFRHQASPRESTQRWKAELWARNVREFCLNADFIKFRNLLHAVKLRHGTDGFISPLKEGVLRIFSP